MVHYFESKRFSYSQLNPSDNKLYHALYKSPKVMQYIGEPLATNQIERLFQQQLKPWTKSSGKLLTFSVRLLLDNTPIGLCGVATKDSPSQQGEIGVLLSLQHQSKGYGTEIMQALSKYCFNELHYNKLIGPPFPSNLASIKMLKNAGYKHEATLRQNQFLQGKYYDTPLYTLLKEECTYLD